MRYSSRNPLPMGVYTTVSGLRGDPRPIMPDFPNVEPSSGGDPAASRAQAGNPTETPGTSSSWPSPAGSRSGAGRTERPAESAIQLLPVDRATPATVGRLLDAGRMPPISVPRDMVGQSGQSGWGCALGFVLVLAGAVLAAVSGERWTSLTDWAGEPWTSETCRWLLSGFLVIGGVSFLSAKPIAVLFTSALVLFTLHCVDVLATGWLTVVIESVSGIGAGPRVMAVAAVGIGYLTYTFGVPATSARGAVALMLTGLAGVGVIKGWYEKGLGTVAAKLGSDTAVFVGQWSEECTWAVALILAAIGLVFSRTRLMHFLAAVLLGAMAYHCIQSGSMKVVSFAGGETAIPNIETVGLGNVALWRWVAAGELVLLSLILLHLSLGVGGLSLAFACVWMIAGLAAYHEVGKLSLARLLGQGVAQHQAAQTQRTETSPLGMWGLPLADPTRQGRQQSPERMEHTRSVGPPSPAIAPGRRSASAAAGRDELDRARRDALESVREGAGGQAETELVVTGVTPVAWIYLTALLAGIIAVVGLRMLIQGQIPRALLLLALWFSAGLGSAWLGAHWPRDSGQSWVQWMVAFGTARYHEHLIWLVFVVCMAVAGLWALWLSRSTTTWIHASIYCTFLGTVLSLIAVAGLIRYGGFPRLPVWTYIVLAAGQSSLAWVLMMHLSLSGERLSRKV